MATSALIVIGSPGAVPPHTELVRIVDGLWFTVAAEGIPHPTAATAYGFGDDRTAVAPGAWLVGAALGLGGLVVLMGKPGQTPAAARARRDD